MSDQPDSLVLVFLRRMDAKIDRVLDEIGEIKTRLSLVESGLFHLQREVGLFLQDARP